MLILSFPTLIQTLHLFDSHEHLLCTSDTEQHYHELDDVDCEQLHYQFEVFSNDFTSLYNVVPLHIYSITYNEQPQVTYGVHYAKKAPRGPPVA